MRSSPRYAWEGPTSALGLALAVLALHPGRRRVIDGALEAQGPLSPLFAHRFPKRTVVESANGPGVP